MHPLLWFGFKSLPFLQRIVLRSLFIWKSVPTLCICSNPNFSQSLADACERAKSLQLCPTLCDSMDYSPPGFSVHGILQARILEWVAIPFSRGSSQPRAQTHVSCISCIGGRFFTPEPPGKSWLIHILRKTSYERQSTPPPQGSCVKSAWSEPPAETSFLGCRHPLAVVLPSCPSPENSPQINHLNKNSHLRLCFQGTYSQTINFLKVSLVCFHESPREASSMFTSQSVGNFMQRPPPFPLLFRCPPPLPGSCLNKPHCGLHWRLSFWE